MTEQNQNKPSLARVYREATQHAEPNLDAAMLAAAASGALDRSNREQTIASLAGSAAAADLYRLLHDLQPASASLAQTLADEQAPSKVVPFQRPQSAPPRAPRPAQRAARWAGLAVAAAVLAAVVIAVPHEFRHGAGSRVAEQGAAAGDEIFRADGASRVASNRGDVNSDARSSDTIFSASGERHDDAIFSGRFNGS